jgi:RHH-type proline utilization regulon transcriptional repressor/proline dehydrogenase/delta 1-pyrroline-5-carboxylate dehydrogenase
MINSSESISKAKEIIASVKGKNYSLSQLKELSIELTALLLKEAQHILTSEEKHQLSEISRMMEDPKGKLFAFTLTDQCFRSNSAARTADQVVYVLKNMGIPKFFPPSKRFGLRLFKWFARWMPRLFVPRLKHMLRKATSKVILPGEPKALSKHMAQRKREGVRINLNHIGEMILGEEEAERRLKTYIADLRKPDVEYMSIKISTIFSQINPLSWDQTLDQLADRLRDLYRICSSHPFIRSDGTAVPKFINIDMEEQRDLGLTVDLFCKVLSEPEFLTTTSGIVLQSYLPEAFAVQQRLTNWALQRVADGGAPIKIRIVKGANLAMEKVESSLKNWPQAPYQIKDDVDANFKQMLSYGCQFKNAKAVHIGVASHNLFDISLALLLRAETNVEEFVNFEMLEGMADNIRRTVQMITGEVLLYCPAATQTEFQNAVAYLIRRLDENTAPENFLRHLFGLRLGSKDWQNQAVHFSASCDKTEQLSNSPRRNQNRGQAPIEPNRYAAFENDADTDWSIQKNGVWISELLSKARDQPEQTIPLMIDGKEIMPSGTCGEGYDPSRPNRKLYRYALATAEQIEQALQCSEKAKSQWQKTTPEERSLLLAAIAQKLREHRGELIAAMVADGGKTVAEADVEVSEAIDFAEYYRRNIEEVNNLEDIEWTAKGSILVAPPWNFPCSIPVGCIVAALAAGNAVIFKPASKSVLVGWMLAQLMWDAGVDKKVLQFVTCNGGSIGSLLVKDPRIAMVMLTGSTATANLMLNVRPDLDLIAETGGKNAIIVSAMADRDLAIKEIIHSAFGHAGQKCSACSIAILEAEIYDDLHFRHQLRDAAQSLPVGNAWNPSTRINPLISPPDGPLKHVLTKLDSGEEWLLKPKQDENNPQLLSPGIVMGVKEGSFIHQTELFGPVLALMRADNLTHAIKIANGTPYGLTAGLQSLDPREHKLWEDNIDAGNLYINRSITGAIVQRQPFGGRKDSSFGRGSKAGGPNYLMQLMHAKQRSLPKERGKLGPAATALTKALENGSFSNDQLELWTVSAASYAFYWNGYFSKDHDPTRLLGQDNILRFTPHKSLTLRVSENDSSLDLLRAAVAGATVGCELEISASAEALAPIKALPWPNELAHIKLKEESEEDLISRISNGEVHRLRLLSPGSEKLLRAAVSANCRILVVPVVANGRVELLNFLQETSLSIDYHRYGNLGVRESEKRRPLCQPEE